jgi:formylglycine-generating enzyme required for sulfatase activity
MFDLPTEAQWEYACRAGTDTALNTGKNLTDKDICPNMAEAGRYKANSRNGDKSGDTSVATAKAGSYPPNAWGLYDMHGNVWEWCLDWLGKYPGTESDPKGVATGSNRVGRGGSWSSRGAYDCRAADRFNRNPSSRALYIGFRAILTLP